MWGPYPDLVRSQNTVKPPSIALPLNFWFWRKSSSTTLLLGYPLQCFFAEPFFPTRKKPFFIADETTRLGRCPDLMRSQDTVKPTSIALPLKFWFWRKSSYTNLFLASKKKISSLRSTKQCFFFAELFFPTKEDTLSFNRTENRRFIDLYGFVSQ